MIRVFRWSLGVCAAVALLTGTAAAQVTNGEVIGKVTDQTNAGVPGVTVTLESTAIQQPMVTVTQASGAYRFVQVPIGTYTVTFTIPGFKTVKRAGVVDEDLVTGRRAERRVWAAFGDDLDAGQGGGADARGAGNAGAAGEV